VPLGPAALMPLSAGTAALLLDIDGTAARSRSAHIQVVGCAGLANTLPACCKRTSRRLAAFSGRS